MMAMKRLVLAVSLAMIIASLGIGGVLVWEQVVLAELAGVR